MKAVQLRVFGRVQGVFYRAATRQIAQKLKLTGWVKNEEDGSVSIHVQGDDLAVDSLVEWAGQGPEHALVSHVNTAGVKPARLSGFKIRY